MLKKQIISKGNTFFLIIFFIGLVSSCTITADCPINSVCSNNFCVCQSGFIFNCSQIGNHVSQHSSLTGVSYNISRYFILNSQINQELEYQISLTDTVNANIGYYYDIDLIIDLGVYQSAGNDYKIISRDIVSGQLVFKILVKLAMQVNYEVEQHLILKVKQMQPAIPSIFLNYNYSTVKVTNVFVILGYCAGGILGLATILFVIFLYRKTQRERTQTQNRQKQAKNLFDITHFDQFMPAMAIKIQSKKQKIVCSVCLLQFDILSQVRTTICQHIFHSDCLDHWCSKNLTCPMCRTGLSKTNILKIRIDKFIKEDDYKWIMNSINQDEATGRQPLQRSNTRSQGQL